MGTTCPICTGTQTNQIVRRFSLQTVANYFIPRSRSAELHACLLESLHRLWGGNDNVTIRKCAECGFSFADPFVAGDASFYNLVNSNDPHYPRNRWEFGRTIKALKPIGAHRNKLRVLEVGAGEGWFLDQLLASTVAPHLEIIAAEYNLAAIDRLVSRGIRTISGSILDVIDADHFDVICLFQTIEHLDRIDDAFASMARLVAPGGHVFLSAPYQPSVEIEEAAAGFSELPPQHVWRWLRRNFEIIAARHGLVVVDYELEPPWTRIAQAWLFAVYKTIAQANAPGSLSDRVNALRFRAVRGSLKRVLALRHLPSMWTHTKVVLPHNQWVHLWRDH